MSVFLDGLAIRFFSGIGSETQFIAPFSTMNFFIGANNAGKSIVLNVIAQHLSNVTTTEPTNGIDPVHMYRGEKSGDFQLAVCKREEEIRAIFLETIAEDFQGRTPKELADSANYIFDRLCHNDMLWLTKNINNNLELFPTVDIEDAAQWSNKWQYFWQILTGQGGGSPLAHWVPETLSAIASSVRLELPKIHLIPAKRQLGEKGEVLEDLSGRGLIDHLASLQNPKWDQQDDRVRFERINQFLREITGKPDALLEVPSEREHLLVHMDNKVLPLSSLGTGIHEVVLIAAFCTIHDGSIMCIEEPEIHLHPLLQKKLVNYLLENTSSQYFIATHSSAFIDAKNSSIFHVSNDGIQTYVKPALSKNEHRAILDDLGCQASDLLQSNAVIWVEGPSDRIYLNHWLSAYDDSLTEGVHYSIMFYGGGLVSHLTTSDEELTEFINLRKLNRNMAILLDSDRSSASDDLKLHAFRIVNEMSEGSNLVWVTAGREVENYIDGSKLQAAMKTIHSQLYVAQGKTGQYDHAFYFMRKDPKKPDQRKTFKEGNKVKAANIICSEAADLDILDLRERIAELVAMIRKANNLTAI